VNKTSNYFQMLKALTACGITWKSTAYDNGGWSVITDSLTNNRFTRDKIEFCFNREGECGLVIVLRDRK
jgi:hypothetical protein